MTTYEASSAEHAIRHAVGGADALSAGYAALPGSFSGASLLTSGASSSSPLSWTAKSATVATALGWYVITDPQWAGGAVGDGVTDSTTALAAAVAALPSSGSTLYVPPGTFLYTSVLTLPKSVNVVGAGTTSVLKGPGLSLLNPPNTFPLCNLRIADILLDGSSYDTSGRGIDLLSVMDINLDRVDILGYQDQAVFDQCQRVYISGGNWRATTNTRSGWWIPYGPEAHSGVVASAATTNIFYAVNTHLLFNNSSTGIPIVDDGGLQHTFDNVQVSYGAYNARFAGVTGLTLRCCDFEFATSRAVLTANTTYVGGVTSGKVNSLTIGPGNYIASQSSLNTSAFDVAGVDSMVITGNDFSVPNNPVFINCSTVTSIISFGNANFGTGGTLYSGNSGGSGNFVSIERTGLGVLRQAFQAFNFRTISQSNNVAHYRLETPMSSAPSVGNQLGLSLDNNSAPFLNSLSGTGWYDMLGGTKSITHNDGAGNMSIPGSLAVGDAATTRIKIGVGAWPGSGLVAPLHPWQPGATVAPTANLLYLVRVIVPYTGTLHDVAAAIVTASGNLILCVYDTGQATANTATKLWDSGSFASVASTWNSKNPALAVTTGQQVFLGVVADNTSVQLTRGGQSALASLNQLPVSFLGATSAPVLYGTSSLGSFAAPSTLAFASISTFANTMSLCARVA